MASEKSKLLESVSQQVILTMDSSSFLRPETDGAVDTLEKNSGVGNGNVPPIHRKARFD